ncbi:MAG: acetyl-CoA carboxylase biotin carboxylase subunit family protein [Acidimicrobiales bacterium]
MNIFVLGLDEPNRVLLEALPGSGDRYRFHPLLDHDTIRGVEEFAVEEWLDRCRGTLDAFEGGVDGIVSFWDFPVTEMAAILCAERGLPSPSLDAVMRCQHKYWSRLVQRGCIPEHTPAFAAFDPFDDMAMRTLDLEFPYWVKPVRSFRSHLGFRIGSESAIEPALTEIRNGIDRISEPLEWLLDQVETPPEVSSLAAHACIAEQLISGHQCTLEGYVHHGTVHAYGVVDSFRAPNRSTFTRYQYPSHLPEVVQDRMNEVTATVLAASGYDHGAFNVEFFYDTDADHLWLLEINCRASQSHGDLFAKVDGVANLKVVVDLAVGQEPEMPSGAGEYACAAKFFLRCWHDATVMSVPTPEEIAALEEIVPGTSIQLHVTAGDRLSELPDQDSYSFELGEVHIGADTDADLRHKFEACERALGIALVEEGEDW